MVNDPSLRIQICPKNPGFPLCSYDLVMGFFDHQSYEFSGSYGFLGSRYKTHRIHGTGIFPYIYHKNPPNVGKYTINGSYGKSPQKNESDFFS